MQHFEELNSTFAIPDCLSFDEPFPGMPRARVTTPSCSAELYLQGAHLTQWQPAGAAPVLFLSSRSAYVPGKAIRGGIPVIFPWFGAPQNSPVHPPPGSPSHGFARTWPWTLRFAALAGENLHLSLTLDHNDRLHALGFDFLQLGVEVVLGRQLEVRLIVGNAGQQPFRFEEALHTYLAVGEVAQVTVEGLGDTEYLDKPDNFRRKHQAEPTLSFDGEVDRPYLNTEASLTLMDPVLRRRLLLSKTGSATTVVWNPAATVAAGLSDLGPEEWQHFVCLETANAADNVLTLAPQQAHTMTMSLEVLPL